MSIKLAKEKTMLKIVTLITAILLSSPAFAMDIQIVNNSKEKVFYWCYRIDHKIKGFNGPLNYAGGELDPGKGIVLENREGRIHCIRVKKAAGDNTYSFCFEGDNHQVTTIID
uniref:Uncharacterized protein n=1 Tax=viral metagenome TaxID=1070528 RepID=A0A6M3IN03_9ZZZZ